MNQIVAAFLILLASPTLCSGEDVGEARRLPEGYSYPELAPAYEGKRVSDLGPILSLKQLNSDLPDEKPTEVFPNEFILMRLFEMRLAHPSSFNMPALSGPKVKLLEVTLVDGTRLRIGAFQSVIYPPDGDPVPCILLKENHYKNRMAIAEKSKGEQGGADQPATRFESDSEDGDKPQPESEGRSR